MVTDDERRAAANTIRRYNRQADCMYLIKYAACKGDLDASESAFLNRLADLIEPEPERTCHIKISDCTDSLGQKMYRCSECGSLTTDDACFFEGEPDIDGFSYCPNCGAKVVEK